MIEVQMLLNLWLQVLWMDLARRIYVWNISEVSLSDYLFPSFFIFSLSLSLLLNKMQNDIF